MAHFSAWSKNFMFMSIWPTCFIQKIYLIVLNSWMLFYMYMTCSQKGFCVLQCTVDPGKVAPAVAPVPKHLIQVLSPLIEYFQHYSSTFNLIQVLYTLFKYSQPYSSAFNLIQVLSTLFKYFQPYSSTFNLIQVLSTLFKYF